MRILAVIVPTILSVFALAQPASAPPLPEWYQFHHNATLDRSQVIEPPACTLRSINVEGIEWGYCEERPEEVDIMLPIIDWE